MKHGVGHLVHLITTAGDNTVEAKKKLRALVRVRFGDEIGCHDSGCVYGHAGGQQTNGGCSCLKQGEDGLRLTAKRLRLLLVYLLTEDET